MPTGYSHRVKVDAGRTAARKAKPQRDPLAGAIAVRITNEREPIIRPSDPPAEPPPPAAPSALGKLGARVSALFGSKPRK